jgi:anti-sigma factor ChrR (cupin superfamily)
MNQPEINSDCTKFVMVSPDQMIWEETGNPGETRCVLERVNDEKKGRETSLVRYAPGTRLEPKNLPVRLEIFVIEGSFSDGHGDHGPGTFVMNPPGTDYTAASSSGCLVYTKRLWGFSADNERVVIDTNQADWSPFGHRVAEVVHFYVHEEREVTARVGRVFPDAQVMEHDHPGGEEVLILDGAFIDQFGRATPGTWLRYPIGLAHAPSAEKDGARIYIRDGDVRW